MQDFSAVFNLGAELTLGNNTLRPRFDLASLSLVLATTALWGLTHGYAGNWHDDVLYAAQALQNIYPANFSGDMFFVEKSQGDYSIFGQVFAQLIKAFGLETASIVGLLAGQIAWLIAAILLARRLVPAPWHWFAVILIIVYPRFYDGPAKSIAYAEAFLTARTWAEPLVLAAVTSLVVGRTVAGLTLLGIAITIHPIMAFPGVVLAFYFLVPPRLSIWVTVAGVALAILGPLVPLANHLASLGLMDADWYAICVARSPIVFLSNWTISDFREPAFMAAVMIGLYRFGNPPTRRLAIALLAATASCLCAAAIASHWPTILLLQMQTLRAWWLAKVLGLIMTVALVRTLWRSGGDRQLLAASFVACFLDLEGLGPIVAPVLVATHWAVDRYFPMVTLPRAARLAGWTAVSLVALDWTWGKVLTIFLAADGLFATSSENLLGFRGWIGGLDYWFMLAAAATIALAIFSRGAMRQPAVARTAFLLALISAIAASQVWNRNTWGISHHAENSPVPPELVAIAQVGKLIYFEGGHLYLWLKLHRASYGSDQQAAGMIFSQAGAHEARRRLLRITLLNAKDGYYARHPILATEAARPATAKALRHVCHDDILDFVVLNLAVAGIPTQSTFNRRNGEGRHFIYECVRIRALGPDPYPGLS